MPPLLPLPPLPPMPTVVPQHDRYFISAYRFSQTSCVVERSLIQRLAFMAALKITQKPCCV
ncbi:MAG: hypothetical protein KME42_18680 [Tildeniella nuda ZEHNDER 1965/U140]|nr:hypothetical protein [Tildeniella nuda ZEHNDER 1965/U140]